MERINATQAPELAQAAAAVMALRRNDRETLIDIGVALETVLHRATEERAALAEVLGLCLEGLQALYLDWETAPDGLPDALATAILAAERLIRPTDDDDDPQLPADVSQSLRALLERVEGNPPSRGAPDLPPSSESPEDKEAGAASDGDEEVKEFLVESWEGLNQLDRDIEALEQYPSDRDILCRIFRTFHSIKGHCGFLGFSKLEALTHAGEGLLSLLRDGDVELNRASASALLLLVEAVRNVLSCIETSKDEGSTDYSGLIGTLACFHPGDRRSASPGTEMAPASESADPLAGPSAGATAPCDVQPTRGHLGEILIQQGYIRPEELARALQQQKQGTGAQRRQGRPLGDILLEWGVLRPEQLREALQLLAESRTPGISENSLRVEVALLDDLMRLLDELAALSDEFVQYTAGRSDAAGVDLCLRLSRIATELHQRVVKTQMQPIDHLWRKHHRLVHNLAMTCGKQVRLEMEGGETEIHRAVAEAIKDPLTHILRNCVDHGIETPAVRLACGKPAAGHIRLRAFYQEGQVHIEVSDDGAGLDLERIKEKALERGLITAEQARQFGEAELVQLVFLPSFSTTERVTSISGRGVGMDVVKANIERVGGTIDLQSRRGQGTTLILKIPTASRAAAVSGCTTLYTMTSGTDDAFMASVAAMESITRTTP